MKASANFFQRLRYTLWAPIYDLVAGHLGTLRQRSLAPAKIKPGDRVLLLGAGTGLDLDFLPAGARITAVDVTPAMVARLKRRAARLGVEVDARVMDGQKLQFQNSSFDVVVLHFIIAVIPDPVRCMKEAARVLSLNGRAVVLDKFISDNAAVPVILRLLNPLARLIATDITRRLGPIVAGSGLRIIHEEPLRFGGFVKMALLRKT